MEPLDSTFFDVTDRRQVGQAETNMESLDRTIFDIADRPQDEQEEGETGLEVLAAVGTNSALCIQCKKEDIKTNYKCRSCKKPVCAICSYANTQKELYFICSLCLKPNKGKENARKGNENVKKVEEKEKRKVKYKFPVEVSTIEKSIYFSEFVESKGLLFEIAAFKKFVDALLKGKN